MISYQKEIKDTLALAEKIREDNWIDKDTIMVCCSPDYSSLTCQLLNHSLSSSNDHELIEQVFMEMPYPVMSQVWDRQTGEYISFDKYVTSFIGKLDKNYKYLFVDTATLRGKNFTRVRQSTTARDLNVRYASVYLENDSIFTPDYFQEKFSNISDPLIFEWENSLNKNWNY